MVKTLKTDYSICMPNFCFCGIFIQMLYTCTHTWAYVVTSNDDQYYIFHPFCKDYISHLVDWPTCWPLFSTVGSFWPLGPIGPFWPMLVPYVPLCTNLNHVGPFFFVTFCRFWLSLAHCCFCLKTTWHILKYVAMHKVCAYFYLHVNYEIR